MERVDPKTLGARCDLCPLGKDPKPVFASKPANGKKLKLIMVGEAPGRVEQRIGAPFLGPSGQLVNRTLLDAGAGDLRAHSYLTNAALCRGDGDQENEAAAVCCAPRLYNELNALPKNVPILALGKAAAKSVLNVKSILMARGFVWTAKEIDESALKAARRLADKARATTVKTGRSVTSAVRTGAEQDVTVRKQGAASRTLTVRTAGRRTTTVRTGTRSTPRTVRIGATRKALPQVDPRLAELKATSLEGRAKLAGRVVFPTIHPAFVLRADTWKPVFQIDIRRAVRFVNGELGLNDLPVTGPYVVVSDLAGIKRELKKLGPQVAVDIETTGIDPHTATILCIGVSDGEKTVVIGPWCAEGRVRPKPGFARELSSQLEWREGVWMHNGFGYDQIAMRRDGVTFGENLEDTLQAHHCFASHLPQRLDQVVSEFCDSMPWKVKFGRRGAEEKGLAPHKMPPDELYMYNCLSGSTPVVLASGETRRISEIVRGKQQIEVLSLGRDGIEPRRVIGWHRQQAPNQKWIQILSEDLPATKGLVVTPDHEVWTDSGWKQASEVKSGDKIAAPERMLMPREIEALLGTLLGDSNVVFSPTYRNRKTLAPTLAIKGGHTVKSRLTEAKVESLRGWLAPSPPVNGRGFSKEELFQPFRSANSFQIRKLYPLLYELGSGRRRLFVPTLEQLGPVGFAWWFMDDGCRQNGQTTPAGTKMRDTITIAACRYPREDVDAVAMWLTEKFGRVGVYQDKVFRFSVQATDKFCEWIAKYVFPCCRYKLPQDRNWPDYLNEPLSNYNSYPALADVTSVRSYIPPAKTRGQRAEASARYCLTVIGNHNFFTSFGLVKNCGDAWRTARCAKAMQADLEPERSVYEHDKKLALICQEMQITGILMDVPHRDMLARKIKRRASFFKGRMRRLVKSNTFAPSKANDIRKAIFKRFKAPVYSVTPTGLASTASATLEELRQNDTRAGRLAGMVLDWRGLMKIKSTYLDAITVGDDSRVRVSWKPWGTVSGRWASRLQSTPRAAVDKITGKVVLESRVREVYVAREGYKFVYFDESQAEMRFAAFLSGDPRFIEEMNQKDPYLARARSLFPKSPYLTEVDEKGKVTHPIGKELRQIAKTASLAANYLADAEQVFIKMKADGFPVKLNDVVAAFDQIHVNYRAYFRYVEKNLEFCRRYGFLRTPIVGRKRVLGFYPKATDVSNTPIQSGIADITNLRLIEMWEKLPKHCYLVLQVHDACVFECAVGKPAESMKKLIADTWSKPVVIPKSDVCAQERSFMLPIEMKEATRWSEL